VTVEVSELLPTNRFGNAVDRTYARALTTGVVVDSAGRVLVAARPVLTGDKIVIRSGQTAVSAEIAAIDYQTELALLQPEVPIGLPAVASSRHTCAGQMVVAMSYVTGQHSSASLGFCAGLRNDGSAQFSLFGPAAGVGTAVFDLSGELVGFVGESSGGSQALVLAVPGYQVPIIVSHLVNRGDRQSGFAGITSQEIEISPGIPIPQPAVIPASSGQAINLVERGVVVTRVLPASPAQRAGLAIGDLVYAVDAMPVNSAAGLANLVRQSAPGTRLDLDIIRQNQRLTIPLVIGRKSLDLSATAQATALSSASDRLVDSLRQALQELQGQINRLERRLETLD
jgi:S1-C subfamily serine protease